MTQHERNVRRIDHARCCVYGVHGFLTEDLKHAAVEQKMPGLHMRDTLYGDWGCHLYDMMCSPPSSCGRFCADAGMVCIADYAQIAAFNPDFITLLEQDLEKGKCHYAAVVHNFCGEGAFLVEEDSREEDSGLHLVVSLFGEDAGTGRRMHFRSAQTSL